MNLNTDTVQRPNHTAGNVQVCEIRDEKEKRSEMLQGRK